jgi:hypothetical protein
MKHSNQNMVWQNKKSVDEPKYNTKTHLTQKMESHWSLKIKVEFTVEMDFGLRKDVLDA